VLQLRRNVGQLSGGNLGSIATVANSNSASPPQQNQANSAGHGATGGFGVSASPRGQGSTRVAPPQPQKYQQNQAGFRQKQKQNQGDMEVPDNLEMEMDGSDDQQQQQQQQQQQIVPRGPAEVYSPVSLGFRDETLARLTVSELMKDQIPPNAILLELEGISSALLLLLFCLWRALTTHGVSGCFSFQALFYEEVPNADKRCREFQVYDKSSEQPLTCFYWEVDAPLGELGPGEKVYRLVGTKFRPQKLQTKEVSFLCFAVRS